MCSVALPCWCVCEMSSKRIRRRSDAEANGAATDSAAVGLAGHGARADGELKSTKPTQSTTIPAAHSGDTCDWGGGSKRIGRPRPRPGRSSSR